MSASRDRLILGIVSIILLVISLTILFSLSFNTGLVSESYRNMIIALIFGFNLVILLSWFSMGAGAGIPATLFLMIITLWVDLRTGMQWYPFFIISFCAFTFIGHRFTRARAVMAGSYMLKIEKLEEDINILSNRIREKRYSMQSLEEKMLRYSELKEVAESFSTVLSLDDINKLVIEKTAKVLQKSGRILLFLVDEDRQELILSASRDGSKVMTKKGDVFDRWILRHRKSLIIEDAAGDFRFSSDDIEQAKHVFRSFIATPLINDNKIIGILRVDSPEEVYTQEDLRLLDIISGLGAVAIGNAILYSRIQGLAIRDGLTGLLVRRYFMERFKEEIKRAARKKDTLSLIMLDIDRFKNYNDRYGHTAGDLILKYLAREIMSIIHEGDIAVRYGGEEIAILLYGKNKKEAEREAENIRLLIKDKPFTLRRQDASVTVSLGISNFPADGISEEELIRAADERLYKAKADGRDRICSA